MIARASMFPDPQPTSLRGESRPIRVMCVDDNQLVAEAIATTLKLAGGFEWVGHLSNADDLVERVSEVRPDVVLLDIDMPGRDAFDALSQLREGQPDARVIMLTGMVRVDLVEHAIDAGAWGYLSKNDGPAIIAAIRQVAEGEFVLGPEVQAMYLQQT